MLYYYRLTQMPTSPHQRRQYLVDRTYQLRVARQLLTVLFLIVVGSSLVTSVLMGMSLNQPELGSNAPLIAAAIAVFVMLSIQVLVGSAIVWVVSIRQSHRVVGPMARIKRTLEAIGNGDFSQRLTLRKGDVLQDLAEDINQMAQRLEQRFPRSS
jgi:methyl-accepting chemotaxis protein